MRHHDVRRDAARPSLGGPYRGDRSAVRPEGPSQGRPDHGRSRHVRRPSGRPRCLAVPSVLLGDESRERRAARGARHVHGHRRIGGDRRQAWRLGARQADCAGLHRRPAHPPRCPGPVLLVRSELGLRARQLRPRRPADDPVAGARRERREPGGRAGWPGSRHGRDRRVGVLRLHGPHREPLR